MNDKLKALLKLYAPLCSYKPNGWEYNPQVMNVASHCGSIELHDLKGIQLKQLIIKIANSVLRGRGNILYYCPKQKQYETPLKRLKSLGFVKLYDFTHLGFLNREPDHGQSSLYVLSFTKEDQQLLKDLSGKKKPVPKMPFV